MISIEVTNSKKRPPNTHHLSLSKDSPKQLISKQELISILLRTMMPIDHKKMNHSPRQWEGVTLIALPNRKNSLNSGGDKRGSSKWGTTMTNHPHPSMTTRDLVLTSKCPDGLTVNLTKLMTDGPGAGRD